MSGKWLRVVSTIAMGAFLAACTNKGPESTASAAQEPASADKSSPVGMFLTRAEQGAEKFGTVATASAEEPGASSGSAEIREADNHLDRAEALAARGQKAAALQEAKTALAKSPGYPRAQKLIEKIEGMSGKTLKAEPAPKKSESAPVKLAPPKRAEAEEEKKPVTPPKKSLQVKPRPEGGALERVAQGRRLLDQGDLEGARREFSGCLETDPKMPEALEGMGRVMIARGEAFEKQGLPGNALLCYFEADSTLPTENSLKKIKQTEQRISSRLRFATRVEAQAPHGEANTDTRGLIDSISEAANAEPSNFVQFQFDRSKEDAAYEAVIKIRSLRVDQKAAGAPPRPVPGDPSRAVPNPDAPRARQRLDEARATLRSMEMGVSRPCPACGGHPARAARCPMCKGTGNSAGVTRGDLMRQRDVVRQLERDLAKTPPLVRPSAGDTEGEEQSSGWGPMKTAEMEAQLLVVRVGTGKIVLEETVQSRVEHADTAPNDGKRLPTHEEIRSEVVAKMGRDIFSKLTNRLVKAKLDDAFERAEKAFADGNVRDSVEARIERIVLLGSLDREKATAELDQLRRGERPTREEAAPEETSPVLPPAGESAVPAAEHTWPILQETQSEGISI
jgi:tetratricopeptide (TPR) repeat protein